MGGDIPPHPSPSTLPLGKCALARLTGRRILLNRSALLVVNSSSAPGCSLPHFGLKLKRADLDHRLHLFRH